jgi:hypothetical protein
MPDNSSFRLSRLRRGWKSLLIAWAVVAIVALVVFLLTWNAFFTYVPAGKHLVITAKDGDQVPPGHILAEKGQKGIQRDVRGEGWHFVLPIVYATEIEDNTEIPAGKVGVVTARGGEPRADGQILADEGQQGIQRHVLLPGNYRINRHGYDVQIEDSVEIPVGFVGVQQRLLGKEGKDAFADSPEEKGILREVLQPGIYFINPYEVHVITVEVGIFQTTLSGETAITFTARGGLQIKMDCTVEWEVRPEDMPTLVAEYKSRANVERNVIDPQAHAIGRDKGINYGVQDFLEGAAREKFQREFSKELETVCRTKNVTVHSAFIRHIEIPEVYMKQIRDKQIAAETKITNSAKEAVARSDAAVEREEKLVDQETKRVQAETGQVVAAIDTEVKNIETRTDAEIEKLKASFQAQIAQLDAEQRRVVAQAENEVKRLKETAQANIYQMKMDVFQNDGPAFLRYSLAEQLNPKLTMRLFHSGPGTFWTNMDGKGVQFMMPMQGPPGGSTRPDSAPPRN